MPEQPDPTSPPPETPPSEAGFEPITSPEQLEKAIGARLARERKKEAAKYADYPDLKAKAEQFDTVQKTAEQRIAAIENELKTERRNALKTAVITEKGLSAAHAKFLVGETREELEAAADELAALIPKEKPKPSGALKTTFGSDSKLDPKERAAQLLRQFGSTSR